jgi:lactoylglutathione lyase
VAILDAGLATLELAEPATAEFIDRVEGGRRVAGHIRVALEVDDVQATTSALAAADAEVIAPPRPTRSRPPTPGSAVLPGCSSPCFK